MRFRKIIILLLIILIGGIVSTKLTVTSITNQDYWPTEGWQTSTPEFQGMNSSVLAEMDDYIQNKSYDQNIIDSILIIKNGYIVSEIYYGQSYKIFGQNYKHYIYSATKSFTSALIGIAIDKGYLTSLDQKVLNFFPNRTFANMDSRKQNITLKHLLAMTSGLDWPETPQNPSNPYYHMFTWEDDWIQYILDKPMSHQPGTVFNYNTGGSHLLSAIIEGTTGMSTISFAQQYLFDPLGITVGSYDWKTDPQGIAMGGSELKMIPRDMAKFGYLYLNNGSWNGAKVLSKEWVTESTMKYTSGGLPLNTGYGYQWWIDALNTSSTFTAAGYGGQYIFVHPERQMVVVFTGSNCVFGFPNCIEPLFQPFAEVLNTFILNNTIPNEVHTTTTIPTTTIPTTTTTAPAFSLTIILISLFMLVIRKHSKSK